LVQGKKLEKGGRRGKFIPASLAWNVLFCMYFFFLIWGVRVSLRTPQLIPGSTEHPASLSQFKKYIISAAVYEIGCIAK